MRTQTPLNSSGFTIVEMMLVMGIMLIISYGASSMIISQMRMNNSVQARTEAETTVGLYRLALANGTTCKAIFNGASFSLGEISLPAGVTDSHGSNKLTNRQVLSVPGGAIALKLNPGNADEKPLTASTSGNAETSAKVLNGVKIAANGIYFDSGNATFVDVPGSTPATRSLVGRLMIHFETDSNFFTTKIPPQKIPLEMVVNAATGTLESCKADATTNITNEGMQLADACTAIGTVVAADGVSCEPIRLRPEISDICGALGLGLAQNGTRCDTSSLVAGSAGSPFANRTIASTTGILALTGANGNRQLQMSTNSAGQVVMKLNQIVVPGTGVNAGRPTWQDVNLERTTALTLTGDGKYAVPSDVIESFRVYTGYDSNGGGPGGPKRWYYEPQEIQIKDGVPSVSYQSCVSTAPRCVKQYWESSPTCSGGGLSCSPANSTASFSAPTQSTPEGYVPPPPSKGF